jgi:hypothetical protein
VPSPRFVIQSGRPPIRLRVDAGDGAVVGVRDPKRPGGKDDPVGLAADIDHRDRASSSRIDPPHRPLDRVGDPDGAVSDRGA